MRRGLIIGGFALLSLVALAGWVRKPDVTLPQTAFNQATPAAYNQAAVPSMSSAPRVTSALYNEPVYTRPVRVQPVVARRNTSTNTSYAKQGRPLSHSIAIVGASSGVGAAIGGGQDPVAGEVGRQHIAATLRSRSENRRRTESSEHRPRF